MVTNGGMGYTSAPMCALTGGGGTGAMCFAQKDTKDRGKVGSVTVFPSGGGYTSAPTCTLTGGGGTGATCTVTIGAGISTTLTNSGSGYTSMPNCKLETAKGDKGTGATCAAFADGTAKAYNSAYPAAKGWDFATGIGTVNASNLVMSPFWF